MKAAGLHVASRVFRIVTLEKTGRGLRVLAVREVPRAEGPPSFPRVEASAEVVAGVAGRQMYIREVSLPFVAPAQIAEVLPYEVEAFLPQPAEEIVLSWLPAAAGRGNGKEEGPRVLAAAVPRETLKGLLADLADGGVDPVSVTGDLFALPDAWEAPPPDGRALFVDADVRETAVLGWEGGTARFAHVLPFGAGEEPAQAAPFAERLVRDLRRILLVAGWEEGLREIRLSGATAVRGEVPRALETLGASVRVWEAPSAAGREALTPAHAIAYGLAVRGLAPSRAPVEFRTGPFRGRTRWERWTGALMVLEACAVLAFSLWGFGAWLRLREARAGCARIEAWREQALAAVPEAAGLPPEEAVSFLRDKATSFATGLPVAGGEDRLVSAWDLLGALMRAVPVGMPLARLDEIRITQREILVRGAVRDDAGKTGADWAWALETACREAVAFSVQKAIDVKPPDAAGETSFDLRLSVKGTDRGR